MRLLMFLGFAATAAVADTAEPVSGQRIEIAADVPTVTIAPRREGRFALRLPGLIYSLTLTMSCDAGWQPASVSVSVADSRKSFGAEQLKTDTALELQLDVPASQIAPLRVEDFCIGQAEDHTITISAALSAQASIRCVADDQEKIRYAARPLDLTLACSTPR